jgi:hypothetical protein
LAKEVYEEEKDFEVIEEDFAKKKANKPTTGYKKPYVK